MPCQVKMEKTEVQRHQVTVYDLTRDMARFSETVPGRGKLWKAWN